MQNLGKMDTGWAQPYLGFPDVLLQIKIVLPFRRKMAKRKVESSLDDIVMEYLKRGKCDKTSKLFGIEHSGGSDHSKSLEKFIVFLKQKEMKKEYRVEDDLGFEINFGAFQPDTKVSFRPQNMVHIIWQNQKFHKSSNFTFSCKYENP